MPVCKNALLKYQNEIMGDDENRDGVNGRNDADPSAGGTRRAVGLGSAR